MTRPAWITRVLSRWGAGPLPPVAPAAPASGIDRIYSPDTLSNAQHRMSMFIPGVYEDIIRPALTEDERRRLASLRFEFPLSVPGQEPLAFWHAGDTVHLSAASLKFVQDVLLARVWLGTNGYEKSTLDDYVLMLSGWRSESAPPPPLVALSVPDDVWDDPKVEQLARPWIRNALQFIMLHEVGHALHDPTSSTPGTDNSIAMELAADRFGLEVLTRLHQELNGTITLFSILAFMEVPGGMFSQSARNTHPLGRERMHHVALLMADHVASFAKDMDARTVAAFRDLSLMVESLADQIGDPEMQAMRRDRAARIVPADLAPRPIIR